MQLPAPVAPPMGLSERLTLAPPVPEHRPALLLALALVEVVWLWVLPLHSSVWVDELIPFWTSYKGVLPALGRSQYWPGLNMPYAVLMAAVIRTAGTSEIALRLPSLLAAVLTTWLIF